MKIFEITNAIIRLCEKRSCIIVLKNQYIFISKCKVIICFYKIMRRILCKIRPSSFTNVILCYETLFPGKYFSLLCYHGQIIHNLGKLSRKVINYLGLLFYFILEKKKCCKRCTETHCSLANG